MEEDALLSGGAEGGWFGGAEVGAGLGEGFCGVDVSEEVGVLEECLDGVADVVVGIVGEGAEGGCAGGEGLFGCPGVCVGGGEVGMDRGDCFICLG